MKDIIIGVFVLVVAVGLLTHRKKVACTTSFPLCVHMRKSPELPRMQGEIIPLPEGLKVPIEQGELYVRKHGIEHLR